MCETSRCLSKTSGTIVLDEASLHLNSGSFRIARSTKSNGAYMLFPDLTETLTAGESASALHAHTHPPGQCRDGRIPIKASSWCDPTAVPPRLLTVGAQRQGRILEDLAPSAGIAQWMGLTRPPSHQGGLHATRKLPQAAPARTPAPVTCDM